MEKASIMIGDKDSSKDRILMLGKEITKEYYESKIESVESPIVKKNHETCVDSILREQAEESISNQLKKLTESIQSAFKLMGDSVKEILDSEEMMDFVNAIKIIQIKIDKKIIMKEFINSELGIPYIHEDINNVISGNGVKLSIGDSVLIKKPKNEDEFPGWIGSMDKYNNQIAEISEFLYSERVKKIKIKLKINGNNLWLHFNPSWLFTI